jgi:hypothetical protein
MHAYGFDQQGRFMGEVPRQKSPLEPGVWLIPANATLVAPPSIPEGQQAVWNGSEWVLEAIPEPEGE